MNLESGQMLSYYRLSEKLGEGGMGVVWKATDTTLDREVAIKVLPEAFAEDTERLARFEREAKALAALNHPNIAAIHSFHQDGGARFLAMELVPGEDLAERLARGPVAVADALEIASQIATALEAAHAAGIVHRDLKPANVKRTPDGQIKVLDFGLAKAWTSEPGGDQSDPSMSPTMTSAGTVIGVILGTASYMSPEQARGRMVDQRADLWAAGVILFEMLTGKPTFPGDDISEVLAGVIKSDPDWDALPQDLPHTARFVLRRCLERNPAERLHSAADLRILFNEARAEPAETAAVSPPIASRRASLLHWVVLAVIAAMAFGGMWWISGRSAEVATETVHFRIDPPIGGEYAPAEGGFFDITPDGRTVVFAAADAEGVRHLYSRDLASLELKQLPGTHGAQAAFISPTGVIGFTARSRLHTTRLGELSPSVFGEIADAFNGGAFDGEGGIIFADDFDSGLRRIAARGAATEELTRPDLERREQRHVRPYVLPNKKAVVFTIFIVGTRTDTDFTLETAVYSFASGKVSILLENTWGPYRYLPSGHLLLRQGARLIAVPFDQETLEVKGPPVPVHDEGVTVAEFVASPTGTLVHTAINRVENAGIAWVDRSGEVTEIDATEGEFAYPSLSQDGKRLAVTRDRQIWIYELDSGRKTKLTRYGISLIGAFSPDGERLLFGSYQPEENLYGMPVDGSRDMELLLEAENRQYPIDWDEENDRVVLQWTDPETGYDIWTMPVTGGAAEPLLDTAFNERWAQLSPDGKWLAFASNETGRDEVYVVSYPDLRGKQAVSPEGGIEPRWSERGDEIFFIGSRADDLFSPYTELYSAPLTRAGETLRIGAPELLFEGNFISASCCGHSYDVTPDGLRFLMIRTRREIDRRLTVETNALGSIEVAGN